MSAAVILVGAECHNVGDVTCMVMSETLYYWVHIRGEEPWRKRNSRQSNDSTAWDGLPRRKDQGTCSSVSLHWMWLS